MWDQRQMTALQKTVQMSSRRCFGDQRQNEIVEEPALGHDGREKQQVASLSRSQSAASRIGLQAL